MRLTTVFTAILCAATGVTPVASAVVSHESTANARAALTIVVCSKTEGCAHHVLEQGLPLKTCAFRAVIEERHIPAVENGAAEAACIIEGTDI